MRDDELRRILADNNPWWRAAAAGIDPTAWVDGYRLLVQRRVHDLGYRSHVLEDIANGPVQRTQPYPETIKLLEKLGAKNNHKCITC